MDGGAWLEDAAGNREWCSWNQIQKHFGQQWIDRQRQQQGWMTGCWVEVDPQPKLTAEVWDTLHSTRVRLEVA
jgi:hypothetical protein